MINRVKPTLQYNGITLVLSNPSRFDLRSNDLLTAGGGDLINEHCLQPDFNLLQCEIRTKDCAEPLLPETRVISTLGEEATHLWLPETREHTIGEVRGSVFHNRNGVPVIPSFYPQDAADPRNLEAEFNKEYGSSDSSDEAQEEKGNPKRRHGVTLRSNYAFWLRQDFRKVIWLAKGNPIPKSPKVNYIIAPSDLGPLIALLRNAQGKSLFLDLETDQLLHITCIGLSLGLPDVYVIPLVNHRYQLSYTNLPQFLGALFLALQRNEAVAHNGAAFDFFVFAYLYKIAIGPRSYDTMLAQHRCFPQVEKSLGHCVSMHTWETFYKHEGNVSYYTAEGARATWEYCGKDVYALILVREAINRYARTIPGLPESIQQANDSIRPYLICQLQGISYDEQELKDILLENDRLMMQYLRIIEHLVGRDNLKSIRGSGKSSIASSNKQCVEYFHNRLGYDIVGWGKPNKETGKRNPSLAKENMFKLRLKYENPVIDFIIAFRRLQKESSTLKFNPWLP